MKSTDYAEHLRVFLTHYLPIQRNCQQEHHYKLSGHVCSTHQVLSENVQYSCGKTQSE